MDIQLLTLPTYLDFVACFVCSLSHILKSMSSIKTKQLLIYNSMFCLFTGIEDLKQILYSVASSIPDPANIQHPYLGRQVPGSYITMETQIYEKLHAMKSLNQPPFITEEEFQEIIEENPKNDIDIIEERMLCELATNCFEFAIKKAKSFCNDHSLFKI